MQNFDELLANLDLKLFEKIQSQSTDDDKRSFLAVQLAVRELRPSYNYLEIGSYLGGSIQPYLLDEQCAKIYSLDKRPLQQPDARGIDYVYQNNSTARMIEHLKKVAPDKLDKLTTIDGESRQIKPSAIADEITYAFIDGEHTDEAVVSDFKFCLGTLSKTGAIGFHDAQITYNGIAECVKIMEKEGRKFRAYSLPTNVFVIEVGDFPLHKNPQVLELLIDNHKSYLDSLQYNDNYRRFATRFPFGLLRRMYVKARKQNISQ